ncbi:MAG: glycosyltransferase family 39 protein [Burkholderiaceae bacterium]|jgi:4-amino-4-deoxy-L-arabinose transferase-like glycosyltransferase|nr:glycosyltransferase family 39 protein [Burkholderiaceae bacterium]
MSFFPLASHPPLQPPRRGLEALLAHPLFWLLALAVAHVVVRVAISPALKWDEAQQMLWSQQLALGYGAQPPLYTWLQWGVNQLFGPGVLALALLKYALIALACVLLWLAARELMGRRAAWWAAASLWLLPPFGWYSVRDLTHTVLVTAMTCGAWWLLLRIARRGGSGCQREFAALGLVCGCGMLAKYNFALMLAALIAALLSVRETRRALFGRGWWWTLLIAGLIVAPYGWWMLSNWRTATADVIGRLASTLQHRWGTGLSQLVMATLGTLALWALSALAVFGSRWWRRPASMPEVAAPWLRPVFGRYLGLIAIALLAMVFVANATAFRSRWLLPLLAPVPLMAFALRPELDADPRGRRMTGLVLALTLAILAAAGALPWFAYITGKVDQLNDPALQLAQVLQNAGYDGRGRIVAADYPLGGTLRTRFPAAPVAVCPPHTDDVAGCMAVNAQIAERAGQGWLLISHTDRSPIEPGGWEPMLARIPGSDTLPRNHLRLPYRMVRPAQPLASYDFVWHPAAAPQP